MTEFEQLLNLAGADLTEANLTNSDLTGANLTGANLTHAKMFGANLTDADLTNVRWSVTTCPDGRLSGFPGDTCLGQLELDDCERANLSFFVTGLPSDDLAGRDFSGCFLANARLDFQNLRSASFAGASLWGADLSFSDLTGANLSGTDLTEARLTGADLTGVIWGNTTCSDRTNSDTNGGTCRGH